MNIMQHPSLSQSLSSRRHFRVRITGWQLKLVECIANSGSFSSDTSTYIIAESSVRFVYLRCCHTLSKMSCRCRASVFLPHLDSLSPISCSIFCFNISAWSGDSLQGNSLKNVNINCYCIYLRIPNDFRTESTTKCEISLHVVDSSRHLR